MYSLVAYSPFTPETWVFEHEKYPTAPRLFGFSKLNLASWRTGSFRSKFTDRSGAQDSCPTINSYRRGNGINRKSTTNNSNNKNSTSIITSSSKNSNRIITTNSIISKNSNSNNITTRCIKNNNRIVTTSSINSTNSNKIITNNTTSSSGIQKKVCTVQRKSIERFSLDSSGSSLDDDEDLYEFDIYEDERRYRPILKRTSKYGPLPIPSSPKYRGIWRIFGSYRKPHARGNPPSTTGGGVPSVVCSPADSQKTKRPMTGVSSTVKGCGGPLPACLKDSCPRTGVSSVFSMVKGCESPLPASLNDHCPGTGVSGDSSTVHGCNSPLPGSPNISPEDPSSDCGYSSDEGIIGDIDWDHFQQMQSRKKEKIKVHFSDPPVTHIYRHSYKSYIPKDAALVTLRL